jgi:hypothetical protein
MTWFLIACGVLGLMVGMFGNSRRQQLDGEIDEYYGYDGDADCDYGGDE